MSEPFRALFFSPSTGALIQVAATTELPLVTRKNKLKEAYFQ
jgi:hypothetical protein